MRKEIAALRAQPPERDLSFAILSRLNTDKLEQMRPRTSQRPQVDFALAFHELDHSGNATPTDA